MILHIRYLYVLHICNTNLIYVALVFERFFPEHAKLTINNEMTHLRNCVCMQESFVVIIIYSIILCIINNLDLNIIMFLLFYFSKSSI